jgi:isopenicillin N synthase-like dioxygenase
MHASEPSELPIIDVAPLLSGRGDPTETAAALGSACREYGFFYVTGHGVSEPLQQQLEQQCRRFFAQDLDRKLRIHMSRGGRAWRGYFPVGEELTSGLPDQKEGLYFGSELAESDPRVVAGTPLHGRNLFPEDLPELRESVLGYMAEMTRLGHGLLAGIARSLGLAADYFATRFGSEPLTLFRVFSYPPEAAQDTAAGPRWGVGEHTDYGVLTILRQDDSGGLEVKSRGRWLAAPPIPGTFVCNLGDMLDRMTLGRYRSTPHRVRNRSGKHRLSFPFFFDPAWDAEVRPIELPSSTPPPDDQAERWDRKSVHTFRGTYGDYLLGKVGKVFPELQKNVLG